MADYSETKNKPKSLPVKWKENVLKPNLAEISRLCKLNTAVFSGDLKTDIFVKNKIRLWLTNITDCVEAIEETL